jgi:hypothetical protein
MAPEMPEQKIVSTAIPELLGEEAREIDPEIERKVLRKIDWFLMPAMVIGASVLLSLPRVGMLISIAMVQAMDWSTTTRCDDF